MLVAKIDEFPVIFYDMKYPVNVVVVSGCDWVFKAKKGSAADYHQEMNQRILKDDFKKSYFQHSQPIV